MPLTSVHLALANMVIDWWAGHPAHAPFSPYPARNRNAFLQGSLAPDMGFFPGGVPLLSELAHNHRPGDLVRALIRLARTEEERAFAWGWLTHVVADVTIHPVINTCARRLLVASGGDPDDAEALDVYHSRVEVGLDVHVLLRHRRVRHQRLEPCLDAGSVEFVRDAYAAVYGLSFDAEWILRAHRSAGRLTRALTVLERLHALAAPGRAPRLQRRLLRLLGRGVGWRLSSRTRAFLEPMAPPRALLRSVIETAASFRETICGHQVDGLVQLGNPDLDGNVARELMTA